MGTMQNVEGERVAGIGDVEEHHVIAAPRGHRSEDCLTQIAVRVDESCTAAGRDVGGYQPMQERALAHAGLPLDQQMAAAVIRQKPAHLTFVTEESLAEDGEVRMVPDGGQRSEEHT